MIKLDGMKKVIKKTTKKYLTENKFQMFEKTFEKHVRAIAKSFSDNTETMSLILKEIRNIHEDNKYFRESISGLNSNDLSYDRKIENLTVRVEKLESKI
jgi:phage-related protein